MAFDEVLDVRSCAFDCCGHLSMPPFTVVRTRVGAPVLYKATITHAVHK